MSYEEKSRKRKFIDEENQEDNLQPKESNSAYRKRLKMELKEKRRAFNSYPHTPSGGAEKTGPNNRRNNSEPASPIDPNHNLSVFSVTRYTTSATTTILAEKSSNNFEVTSNSTLMQLFLQESYRGKRKIDSNDERKVQQEEEE